MRPTIKIGSRGEHVKVLQQKIGTIADGIFGPDTELAVRTLQIARGLPSDGVVGPKTWRELGEQGSPATSPNDPRAPACVAALRDANARWPTRRKQSDGVMGDLSHQARPSDHNLGNAVDITHDPTSGCAGDTIAALAITDPRVQYVIWAGRIWNRDIPGGWRTYKGSNLHFHHVHISIRASMRNDASPWAWAA